MIEAASQAVDKVVGGFAGSPALLLVAVLNIAMIGMCGYALLKIADISAQGRTQIMSVLESCIAGSSDHRPQKGSPIHEGPT